MNQVTADIWVVITTIMAIAVFWHFESFKSTVAKQRLAFITTGLLVAAAIFILNLNHE